MMPNTQSRNAASKIDKLLCRVLDIKPENLSGKETIETLKTWDSMRHMALMIALEKEFGLEFSYKDIVGMTSLQALKNHILEKL